MAIEMDHIVLNVADLEKMLYFYIEILGLQGERLEEFRSGRAPFPSVRVTADTIIDLFPKKLWEELQPEMVCRPNLNHICLAMDQESWMCLRDRLQESKVKIEDGPVKRWGAHGTGTSIYCHDPEGNIIELRYYSRDESDRPCLLGS